MTSKPYLLVHRPLSSLYCTHALSHHSNARMRIGAGGVLLTFDLGRGKTTGWALLRTPGSSLVSS